MFAFYFGEGNVWFWVVNNSCINIVAFISWFLFYSPTASPSSVFMVFTSWSILLGIYKDFERIL